MQKEKGYPLPETAYTEEMACTLVFYPDKPEYRRALGGSLAYLATWIAWEKESSHKGKDAALSWQIAYDLTIGCWEMACLDQLQSDVSEILAIMQMGQSCCDEKDITDGDQYTDRVTDGVGDVPQNIIDAGYADDSADWDGFDDYKCMIVHVTVNQMEARLREIAEIVDEHGIVYGGVAALASVLGVIFATGGLAIIFGLLAGISTLSTLYNALIGFDLLSDLADDIATNHEELACAMYDADGDAAALVALNDKIDELFNVAEAILLKNMNNGPTLKALYSGRYDQQDIAAELESAGYDLEDFDCTCLIPVGEFIVMSTFDAGLENWEIVWPARWNAITGNPDGGVETYHIGGDRGHVRKQASGFALDIGKTSEAGDQITIHRISFDAKQQAGYVGDLRLVITHDDTTTLIDEEPGTSWAHFDYQFDPPLVHEDGRDGWVIDFSVIDGGGMWLYVDNIRIDFDADMD